MKRDLTAELYKAKETVFLIVAVMVLSRNHSI